MENNNKDVALDWLENISDWVRIGLNVKNNLCFFNVS